MGTPFLEIRCQEADCNRLLARVVGEGQVDLKCIKCNVCHRFEYGSRERPQHLFSWRGRLGEPIIPPA